MFKPILGLKASADPQQLASRLRYKPEVLTLPIKSSLVAAGCSVL